MEKSGLLPLIQTKRRLKVFFIMTEVESAEKTRLYVSFQLNAGISIDVLAFYWAEVRRDPMEMRQ